MSPEENARRIKQLELLQAIATRMAQNSFLIKGWAVTLCSALLALSGKDTKQTFALLAVAPALTFWGLDAYYLSLERRYRQRYEELASGLGMSLSVAPSAGNAAAGSALWTRVVWAPYAMLLFIVTLVVLRNLAQVGGWSW